MSRMRLGWEVGVLAFLLAGCTSSEVKPDPELSRLGQRVVDLEAEGGAIRADRDRVAFVRDDLESQVVSLAQKVGELEGQNDQLREQLVERDRLLLAYFHKLRSVDAQPPQPLPRAVTRVPARMTLDERLTHHQHRLAGAELENIRLRESLAKKDQELLARHRPAGATPPAVAPAQPTPPPANPPGEPVAPPAPVAPGEPAVALAPPAVPPVADGAVVESQTPPVPLVPGANRYHLRVISLPHSAKSQERAELIARHLSEKGLKEVKARRAGAHWVVDIGDFPSVVTPEAVDLQRTVRELKYQGRQDFRTAYYTRY